MNRIALAVALALAVASCDEPEPSGAAGPRGAGGAGGAGPAACEVCQDLETVESKLRTADNFWYSTTAKANPMGSYACQGDTWALVVKVGQSIPWNWATSLEFFSVQDSNSPTLAIDCTNASGGAAFTMYKTPTLLYSVAAKTCTAYSHQRNDPGGWFWAGPVTIPQYGLQYLAPDASHQYERWAIDVYPGSAIVGSPGFCGPHLWTTLTTPTLP